MYIFCDLLNLLSLRGQSILYPEFFNTDISEYAKMFYGMQRQHEQLYLKQEKEKMILNDKKYEQASKLNDAFVLWSSMLNEQKGWY